MEKSVQSKHAEKRHRLLTVPSLLFAAYLCAVMVPLNAQKAGQKQQYDPILTVPATVCTAGETLSFTVQVPYIEPADVVYSMPTVPQSVRFTYSKKTQSVTGSDRFTVIELDFTFLEPGTVKLTPLEIIAAGVKHLVAFPEIIVHPELSLLKPSAFWRQEQRTDEKLYAGEATAITLVVKNALEIIEFSCDTDETALFARKSPVSPTLGTKDEVLSSQEGFAAARFLWTPLSAGELSLPRAKLTVRALDDREQTVYTENLTLRILPAAAKSVTALQTPPELTRAFTEQKQDSRTAALRSDSEKTAETIAALRQEERKAFLPFTAISKRQAAEQEAGLQSGEREPAQVWLIPLYVAAFLCSLGAVILSVVKRNFYLPAAVLALVFTLLAVSLHFQSSRQYAVTQTAAVKTVPEQSASTATNLPAGTRVQVLAAVGGWLHIRYNGGRTGWLLPESLIFITGGNP